MTARHTGSMLRISKITDPILDFEILQVSLGAMAQLRYLKQSILPFLVTLMMIVRNEVF